MDRRRFLLTSLGGAFAAPVAVKGRTLVTDRALPDDGLAQYPLRPEPPPSTGNESKDLERWLAGAQERDRVFNERKRAYDATWEEVQAHPAYQPSWNAVFGRKRDRAIKDCIVVRAAREGVRIPPDRH